MGNLNPLGQQWDKLLSVLQTMAVNLEKDLQIIEKTQEILEAKRPIWV